MQMRQRDVAALDAKYTKELADAKAEMMLCVMMLPLVIVGWHQSSLSVVREVTTASGVDNAASRLADTAERDYFTLRERLITMQKQLEGTRSILMSSADRVAHTDGQLMQLLWAIQRASSVEYKCLKSNKTEQSIYECLLGFCFNNIFCAATNFIASTVFFCPIQKRRNDGDEPGATAAGLFWTVNVCWAHPVISVVKQ